MSEEQDAFSLYKRGRQELDHYDRPGAVERAIQDMEKAIALDGQSAASYAALAEAYDLKNRQNADPQWVKLTSQNARRALELSPDLAASHIAAGVAAIQSRQVNQAEKELLTALVLIPRVACHITGWVLSMMAMGTATRHGRRWVTPSNSSRTIGERIWS
jgi:tetratricopeptide (TPR) repeat protein